MTELSRDDRILKRIMDRELREVRKTRKIIIAETLTVLLSDLKISKKPGERLRIARMIYLFVREHDPAHARKMNTGSKKDKEKDAALFESAVRRARQSLVVE